MEHSHKAPFRFLAVRHYQIAGQRDWQPALNMYETDDALYVVVELAGIDPNVLLIDVETSLIRIEGMRQPEAPHGLCRIHRMEIAAGPFQIEAALPAAIDPDQAHSEYKNGLLEIVLPLVKQAPRRVAISGTEGANQ